MPFPLDPASVPYMHIALGACVIGLFSRRQTPMRLALLFSALFALGFWAFDPAAEGGATGALLALVIGANLRWLHQGLQPRPRAPAAPQGPDIDAARAALSAAPGPVFARLMRLGHRGAARHETLLTAAGRRPDALWLVLEGAPRVHRGLARYDRPTPCFVGEASWLTGAPSAATVHLPAGAHFIVWTRAELEDAAQRDPELCEALEASIARYMAGRMVEPAAMARPQGAPGPRESRRARPDRPAWGMGAGGSG